MKKLILNSKNFRYVLLATFVSSFLVLWSHYSSLYSGNSAETILADNENLVFSQDFSSHGFKEDFSSSIAKEKEYPLGYEKEEEEANHLDSCSGRYIYIHDLPSRFNVDIIKNCSFLSKWTNMCEALINNGLGRPASNSENLLQDNSWFATNQFTLGIIFHSRMKRYKCLTTDSSLASAIYVPYYAGFDVGRYLWDSNFTLRDSMGLDLVKWLHEKPEWKKMWGRDHFYISGRISWDFRRLIDKEKIWGSRLMTLPEAQNMTMLAIESSPWSNKDFAIPYPTYFHPSKDSEVLEWQDKVRKQKREYLFSFIGAPRPNLDTSIRAEIIDQCLASTNACKLLDCNSAPGVCFEPTHVMGLFLSSTFCLQPRGDTFTRRSIFDSILAGCIPVFFHPGTAYAQYVWHLPKNYKQYSVFISEFAVKDGKTNIEKMLRNIPEEKVLDMREEVIRLIPKVTYADPRSWLETIEDAFDISVNKVLERVDEMRMEMKQGRSSSFDFPEEFSWKYFLFGTLGEHEWDPFFIKP